MLENQQSKQIEVFQRLGAARLVSAAHRENAPGLKSASARDNTASRRYDNSLALRSDGTMAAWGAGTHYFVNFSDQGQSAPPTGRHNVMAIAAGEQRSLTLCAIAPKPFELTDTEFDPDESLWFLFRGEAGQSYQVQLSDNLIDWFDLLEVYPPTGYFRINDGDAIYYPQTFYRGMAQNYLIAP